MIRRNSKKLLTIREKNVNGVVETVKTLVVVLISLVLVSLVVAVASQEPWNALYNFFIGPFTSLRRFSQIIECMIPLMFTALALIVMFRANMINFAAEGAFFLGALGATFVAVYVPMPAVIHPIACLIVAVVCGMAVTVLPAIIRIRWNASELVASLMMNYLVTNFVIYIVNYKIRDIESGFVASKEFLPTAILPTLFPIGNIHFGLIIAFVITVVCSLFLFYTRAGYDLRMTGENAAFARFSGIKTGWVMLYAQLLGGALAGLGGGVELLGMYTRFRWSSSPGYGFVGLVVAMLARKNPWLVPAAAFFYAYLQVGAEIMGRNSDVTPEVVQLIQAIIVILIASQAFMARWRQKMVVQAVQADEMDRSGVKQ